MQNEWDEAAFQRAKRELNAYCKSKRDPQTPREMREMTQTELAEWSIEHGWAPAETRAEREQAIAFAKVLQATREEQMESYKYGVTGAAATSVGCHLCGAACVKRVTAETAKKKKVEGEKAIVWETKITKTYACGTVASQVTGGAGRTQVKVGKECIDISEITDPIEAKNLDAEDEA